MITANIATTTPHIAPPVYPDDLSPRQKDLLRLVANFSTVYKHRDGYGLYGQSDRFTPQVVDKLIWKGAVRKVQCKRFHRLKLEITGTGKNCITVMQQRERAGL